MNGFGSECSSGCESGWTMYLDHSVSPHPSQRNDGFVDEDSFYNEEYKKSQGKEEDEEDLSMVSDASSGPPHCHEDEEYYDEHGCFSSASSSAALTKKTNKRQKIKPPPTHYHQQQQYHSLLDDTASSPFFSFSKSNFTLTNQPVSIENALDFSQGFSGTHYNATYAIQNHTDFLQSSLPGKSTSAKPVGCRKESADRIW